LQFQSQLPSAKLNRNIYITNDIGSLLQWLQLSYQAIYGQQLCSNIAMILNSFCVLMGTVHDSGAAIADSAAVQQGKYNNLEGSKVVSTYDLRLPL